MENVLQLCKSLSLYIVNGRTRGDSLGRFTYCSVLGSSVVDYAITDMNPGHINAFTVLPQLHLSDHSPTVLYLKKSTKEKNKQVQNKDTCPLPKRYRWTEQSITDYTAALDTDKIQQMLDTFLETNYKTNKKGINLATDDLNKVFYQLTKLSKLRTLRTKKSKQKPKEMRFDSECLISKKTLRKLSNRKHRNQTDQQASLEYLQALQQYKKLSSRSGVSYSTTKRAMLKNFNTSVGQRTSVWKRGRGRLSDAGRRSRSG